MIRLVRSLVNSLPIAFALTPAGTWARHGQIDASNCYSTLAKLPRGWYILSIEYCSNELRGYIRFRANRRSIIQALHVRPQTRRIRVVRLPRPSRPLLEFEPFDPVLQVTQLRLRRISSCQAWSLIRKKLIRSHPKYHETRSLQNRSNAWRDYNRLQCGRFLQSPLATYKDWIRLVEPKLSAALPGGFTTTNPSGEAINFLQVSDSFEFFRPVPLDAWVIATVPGQVMASQAEVELTHLINHDSDCALIYTDHDRISIAGTRYGPNFKPSLNLDLAISDPLYSVGVVFRGDIWNQTLVRLSEYASTHSVYGMFLEAISWVAPNKVVHLPKVLFHLEDTLSVNESDKTHLRATDFTLRTAQEFCKARHPEETEIEAQLVNHGSWGQQVTWALPHHRPLLVSILLPTRDAYDLFSACISSLLRIPAGVEYELIIVDNGSVDRDVLSLFDTLSKRHNISVLRDSGPFNYSSLMNRAALAAKGDVFCLLNNDTQVISENWLAKLTAHAVRTDIGCVGPMLLFADDTVQHAGVILGIGGIAGHAHKYLRSDATGFQARLQLCQNFSAVTGACLVVRSSLWKSLGGLDEQCLPVNYNDVDFCLRVLSAGYRNLYVPQVKLYHYESKSRGSPTGSAYKQWQQERGIMLERWGDLIERDPAYSPHLSLTHEDFSLSLHSNPADLSQATDIRSL